MDSIHKIPHFHDYPIRELQEFNDAKQAVQRIKEIHKNHLDAIQKAFQSLLDGTLSDLEIDPEYGVLRCLLHATYPFVGIRVEPKHIQPYSSHPYGIVFEPGLYGTTVTRPDIFEDYYLEQIGLLMERHKVPVYIGASHWRIPLPFVMDHAPREINEHQLWQVHHGGFAIPDLKRIHDDIANCTHKLPEDKIRPLALFSGERVDFSLHRLHHYTGTPPEHFQNFILLTNYERYVHSFIEYAKEEMKTNPDAIALVTPGNVITTYENGEFKVEGTTPQHLPQMPAYHLKYSNKQGITLINIGVGPSNAKTITDHLAVLRPHCWIMIGHCAGLRSSQLLGDYVLAHGYVREDHVLDQDLPPWIPVPAIAEVQVALQDAVASVSQKNNIKTELRTGTVLTTDNRNWEIKSAELYERFRQSRAIAVDMESATISANGFRFRVPYATLLCISDKPIHGEIKLRGMANAFYRERVSQHLKIGLEAIRLIRERGIDQLHSRKLRGFDEPPFR